MGRSLIILIPQWAAYVFPGNIPVLTSPFLMLITISNCVFVQDKTCLNNKGVFPLFFSGSERYRVMPADPAPQILATKRKPAELEVFHYQAGERLKN
jgi:hypothetical protein